MKPSFQAWSKVLGGDYAEGMLEPSSALSKHCDLLVAWVVCKVKKGTLPIRVINVTNDALTLKRV